MNEVYFYAIQYCPDAMPPLYPILATKCSPDLFIEQFLDKCHTAED